jgi:hypothetical protein
LNNRRVNLQVMYREEHDAEHQQRFRSDPF